MRRFSLNHIATSFAFAVLTCIVLAALVNAFAAPVATPAEPAGTQLDVYFVFTLKDGQVHDVDSFLSEDACKAAMETWQKMLEQAKLTQPALAALTIIGCRASKIPAPGPGL